MLRQFQAILFKTATFINDTYQRDAFRNDSKKHLKINLNSRAFLLPQLNDASEV